MTKTRHICLIAALSIGLMGTAHAQDSAIIEATATINDSSIPLAVSGERSLSFGAVGKPIAELNGSFCTYSIGVAAAGSDVSVGTITLNVSY